MNIEEYLPRLRLYSPIFTSPSANNCYLLFPINLEGVSWGSVFCRRFRVIICGVRMFLNSHLHISHGLTDVAVIARTVSFIDHMWSRSVFVFQIEKAFDLFSLPKDDENVIETREFVQFGNEGLLSLSFLLQEGILIKILLRSSKRKLGIKLSSSGGSSRKLFTARDINA